jgi:hypothetical protein
MNDWDAVSSPVNSQDDGVTDWDAVSTIQPQRPPIKRKAVSGSLPPSPPNQGASAFLSTTRWHISASFLIRLVLFIVVIVGLFSAGHFGLFRVGVNSVVITSATATANAGATALAQGNATATAQAVATAAAMQQMYAQDTSGTPMIDDPLTDNNMGYAWGVQNFSGGYTCGFIAGVYHLSIANSGYGWVDCVGRNIYLNNFVFQVQETIEQSGEAGILFGATANGFYRMDVNSQGTYTLYYRPTNKQDEALLSGFSPLVKLGLNQVNTVALLVNNGELYFYVNNQFVVNTSLNVSGLSYQTGTFGFFVANFGQPADVVYSNLKVWSVP